MTGWWYRAVEYAAVTALVLTALIVAFAANDSSTLKGRLWSVRRAWWWAATDARTTRTLRGATITCTSTKATALRLIQYTIGDL
ncbi:hypothetical protein AB0395_46245 [Streptosporangium sp. NPDC051023]|uniref:hypothetical protein n=1 Tax=Streptosporangium sp. NPDC051023 TaxID=3155410 RepID=UPI00344F615E